MSDINIFDAIDLDKLNKRLQVLELKEDWGSNKISASIKVKKNDTSFIGYQKLVGLLFNDKSIRLHGDVDDHNYYIDLAMILYSINNIEFTKINKSPDDNKSEEKEDINEKIV